MKKLLLILIVVLGLFLTIPSVLAWSSPTSDDEWRSGWGQGVAEAEVTNSSGNKIYVACNDGANIASSVSFTLVGDGPKEENEVMLVFDGEQPERYSVGQWGSIESDSHVGADTFNVVINKLKSHNSVYVRFPEGI